MNVPSKIFVIVAICAGVSQVAGSWAGAAPLRAGGIGGAMHGRIAGGHIGVGGMGGLRAAPGGGFRGPVGGGMFRSGPAGGVVAANAFRGGGREGDWRDDRHRRHGFGLGFATGALIGTALAAPWWWYDDDDYAYVPAYYDYDDYVWDRPDVRYCAMRFKSYDPVTGTYLGYDGRRHPCP
jgi:BA14K-like protein